MHPLVLYTVGHSTREFSELVALLQEQGVRRLVDVRTMPRSRHNPQFNRDRLAVELPAIGMEYHHFPELGGLRKPHKVSLVNAAWRNDSFRGFADYMQTDEFHHAMEQLMDWGKELPTAFMCAESVPWRCHRSLIADALEAQGAVVFHILDSTHTQPHRMTPFAEVRDGLVTYPAAQLSLPVEDSAHD